MNEIKKFKLSDNTFIRYKKIGKGSPLILLHTIRNRLEYCDEVASLLKNVYTVYLMDLPGFGDSSINTKTNYDQFFMTKSILDFIKEKKLSNVTLAGESIGAVLGVTVANSIPKKIKHIFCFNPYDYAKKFGDGIDRGNFFSKFILFHLGLPVVGNLFVRLENKIILKQILSGGFYNKKKLLSDYLDLLCKSFNNPGYFYHFKNVLSNYGSWNKSNGFYETLKTKKTLVYGKFDWSTENEREETMNLLGLKKKTILEECGHFSFLEAPDRVANIISKPKIMKSLE